MKRFKAVLLGAALISTVAASAGTVLAGTYDGLTPSEELVCDKVGLEGAAYGLCVAYCEATDCDLRPDRTDCLRIRENFALRTGSDVLPCDLDPEDQLPQ